MLGHEAHEAGHEVEHAQGVGLDARRVGAAQSASGQRAAWGRGQEASKRAGEHDGSRTPSWYTRPGAAVDNEWGGRTPDLEHGKPGGSAGGQQDGQGHLAGIWNGPIGVAATVAVAVNAALVLLDADVNALGKRFLGKVVGGLAGKRLRKELAEEASRAIDELMPAVERELAKDVGYRVMGKAEKEAAQAQARARLEREYHARARAYFAAQAERSEAIVQPRAGEAGQLAAHERELAAANARAYRELEQAAADNGAGAMKRLEFEPAPYHGRMDKGLKSRGPMNGQAALESSLQVKASSPRRVGIDYDSGEFVVFDQTTSGVFHGHVRAWKELTPEMQTILVEAGRVSRRGKILTD
jgi:hypothetical protein